MLGNLAVLASSDFSNKKPTIIKPIYYCRAPFLDSFLRLSSLGVIIPGKTRLTIIRGWLGEHSFRDGYGWQWI